MQKGKSKLDSWNFQKNVSAKNTWGCFGFDRKQELLFISECVGSIHNKIEKKIIADNYSVATDVAIAA